MPTDSTRAKEILFAALQITDPAERAAYLDRECDAEMRKWVDALLWAHDRPTSPPTDVGSTGVYNPEETGAFEPAQLATDRPPEAPISPESSAAGAGMSPSSEPDTVTGVYVSSPVSDATGAYDGNLLQAPTKTYDSGAAPSEGGLPESRLIGGKYEIVDVIGEGGMGSVYRARQTEPIKRDVALKLIRGGADSRQVVARFEAERQALALMDHPNIARVYDGGTTPEGQPYFVMELVDGVPITKFCDDNRLAPTDRLELFVQVCRAVQHAHQKGIIHRDLKPGNILVTLVDGRPTPKVIDFGVAKAVEQHLTDESFSDDSIVGTPAYMSPEQTDPTLANIDTRTDVYALGVILYELLTGSPPISPKSFRRGAILEMLRMVRELEPEHLSTKASSADALPNIAASRRLEPAQLLRFLRGDVDWIVLKALEKDRERRYESANEMAADILRYLANEPVVARPPNRWYRFKKFVRRNRGAVSAVALVAVALVVGVIGIVWQWREAVLARANAVTERDQKEIARTEAVSERDQKEIARAEAEKNAKVALEQRRVALDTVGEMVTTVRSELANVPNSQRALIAIVGIARKRLDSIIQNPFVNVSLNKTTLAILHDFKGRSLVTTGNSSGALAEFKAAAVLFEAILAQAADDKDKEVVKKNLVIELLLAGQMSLAVGSQADARTLFEKAARVLAGVADKGATDYRKILITLYVNMGKVTIDSKPREARENYRGALRLAEELAQQETVAVGAASDETLLTILQSASALGQAENRVRDNKASEQAYEKARTIAEDRLKRKTEDVGRKRELAHVTERIGDRLLRDNKPADAVKRYAAAAALFRPLATRDQQDVPAQADLARILYSQGLAAAGAKDKAAAAKFFQESLEIRQKRPNLDTETVGQRDLMMSLAQTGKLSEAVDWAEKVRKKLPNDPGALVDIACCYAVCSTKVPALGADKATHDQYVAKALESLKLAIDKGYGDKVNLETEPDLDGIRNLPEFKALVKRLPEP